MLRFRRKPFYAAMKNHFSRRFLGFLIIVFAVYLVMQTFILIETRLKPSILVLAEARVKILTTEVINHAINQNIALGCRYNKLITTQTDKDGNVVSAEINNAELARIQALTTLNIQSALKELETQRISIPIGQILGSKILANWGPKIPVNFVPIGTVNARMHQTFESGGINLICHQVGLDITATVQIAIPLLKEEINVSTYTPIVTATFFGRVPETVINLPMPHDFQFPPSANTE